jgi:hypothetical protein
VVVDNARKMIGKTIEISVTSVLQTTAGKMIFGKWDEGRGMPRQEAMRTVSAPGSTTTLSSNGAAAEIKKAQPLMAERPTE